MTKNAAIALVSSHDIKELQQGSTTTKRHLQFGLDRRCLISGSSLVAQFPRSNMQQKHSTISPTPTK